MKHVYTLSPHECFADPAEPVNHHTPPDSLHTVAKSDEAEEDLRKGCEGTMKSPCSSLSELLTRFGSFTGSGGSN